MHRFVLQSDTEDRFDPYLLDIHNPFEIDTQIAHLFKHPEMGVADIWDVFYSDPLLYPAKPPAHWIMISEVSGRVISIPLAPSRANDPHKCRPIGCYEPSQHFIDRYRRDRDEF